MGILVAVEGIDGAGKRTLTGKVIAELESRGKTVATQAFPRYHESIHADLAAEALRGQHGDLASSVYAMAVMFALDRAGARDELASLCESHDVILLDRYVASNAAYGAARLRQTAWGEFASWIGDLEFGRLKLPRPDEQWYLDVPPELAAARAAQREADDSSRKRDAYERDAELQQRTAAVYRELARDRWHGTWRVVNADADAAHLVDGLLN